MTAHRINPPVIIRQQNQETAQASRYTEVILENKTPPSFIKALATSVALVFAGIIVCLTSPILKLTGLPITDVLKNIGGAIRLVWIQKEILETHSTFSGLLTPLEAAIANPLRNKPQDPNSPLGRLHQLHLSPHESGSIISRLRNYKDNERAQWELTIGDRTQKYDIPAKLADDSNRAPMEVTIHANGISNKVIGLSTLKGICDQIHDQTCQRQTIIQRKSLESILGGLFACSSLRRNDQIDPNLLSLFSQISPGFDLIAFMSLLPQASDDPSLKNLQFSKNELKADVFDESETELKIVYTGSIKIEENNTEIGSISYQKTLVMQKQDDSKWIDVSFGKGPFDDIAVQMNGRQGFLVNL